MAVDTPTSGTMLRRLRDFSDREAWVEFVEQYTPRIYGWCRRWQLQESDAADITQEVLGKLVKALRSFDYDSGQGSFRGWLKTVTNNAVRDFLDEMRRPGRGRGDTHSSAILVALQAPEAISELTAYLDVEAERELLREAEARVQLRVQPHTWQAYWLTAVSSVSPSEVSAKLNMPVAEVYAAKSRVMKLLREEVERLNGNET